MGAVSGAVILGDLGFTAAAAAEAGGLAAGAGEIGAGLGTLGAEATGVGSIIGETGAAAGLGGGGFGAGFGAGAAGLSDAFGGGGSLLGDAAQGAAKGAATTIGKDVLTGQPVTPGGIAQGALTGGAGGAASSVLGGLGAGAGGAAPPVGSGINVGPVGLGDVPTGGPSFIGASTSSGLQPSELTGASADPLAQGGLAKAATSGANAFSNPATSPSGWDVTNATPNALAAAWNNPGFGTVTDALGKNANWLAPVAGLGVAALEGNKQLPGQGQISNTADQLSAQGKQLQTYLQTGQLPPGVQQSLTSAGDAAKAAIRSRHAGSGTAGSSAEQQELAAVDQQISTQGAGIAMQLLNTGVNETNLSAQLYSEIMKSALAEDQGLATAIGGFASSLAGGGGNTVKLQLASGA